MVQILGWLSAEAARASRWNRSRVCGDAVKASGRTLMATPRSRRVSLARYTSPMPPAPSEDWISYGPRRAPAASGMRRTVILAADADAVNEKPAWVHPGEAEYHALPATHSARMYSRVMRAMFEIGISFGQTASHSPSFEQLPKPSSSA